MPKYLDYHGLETLTNDIDAKYVKNAQKGVANGIASLNSSGKIPTAQLPTTHELPAGGTIGQVLTKTSGTDYDVAWTDQSSGEGGTTDYEDLINKPQINNVSLIGNRTLSSLGIAAANDIPDVSGFYTKPSSGIPKTDLSSAVQASLNKADSSLQGEDVTDAVDTYLAENFTNPDSPPLDRTLTSANSAAPADIVGTIQTALLSLISADDTGIAITIQS